MVDGFTNWVRCDGPGSRYLIVSPFSWMEHGDMDCWNILQRFFLNTNSGWREILFLIQIWYVPAMLVYWRTIWTLTSPIQSGIPWVFFPFPGFQWPPELLDMVFSRRFINLPLASIRGCHNQVFICSLWRFGFFFCFSEDAMILGCHHFWFEVFQQIMYDF